jgi:ABC-2 type transport system permease protein
VTAFVVGWAPRKSAVVAWIAVGYCAVIMLFADSFSLPGWTQRGSPFAHTPRVPLDDLTVTPLLVTGLLAAALLVTGYAGLRRRDIGY